MTKEDQAELEHATEEIAGRPEIQWSADQFRLMLLGAEAEMDWKRYVELAEQMARIHEKNPDDRSYALFAIAYGHAAAENHSDAAIGYEAFIHKCPEESPARHASALNNWGTSLDEQAKTQAARGNAAEADELFTLAGEKYSQALAASPNMHIAIANWGNTLLRQSHYKIGDNKMEILAKAENLLHSANRLSESIGSYGLACVAGIRGDAENAARWLRDAKRSAEGCPDCAHIDADRDFDAVRNDPEFRQALIDVGCQPGREGA